MTFIIVCTGTAGHVNPGIAIAGELRKKEPSSEILFIGAGRELENRLVPEAGYKIINIKMSGLRRGFKPGDLAHNIKTAVNLISAGRKAAKIIKQAVPDAVIGMGGYICYPVLKAAAKQKIPVFIHESNVQPGLAVKMLSDIADYVMVTYPGFENLYKHPEKIVVTGTPVREEFFADAQIGDDAEYAGKPLVISFWGSLGASKMNEHIAGFIKRNIKEKSFYHIHATGNSGEILFKTLKKLGVKETVPPYADIRNYIDNMPEVMRRADLVLCRAGATTLAELTAAGKPGVLVPSPYVPDNVQFINAGELEKLGAAVIVNETGCNAQILYETVLSLINDRSKLDNMSQASLSLAKPDAAEDIADLIMTKAAKENSRSRPIGAGA